MKFYEILFSMSSASCLGPFLRLSVFRSIQILYFSKSTSEYESKQENLCKSRLLLQLIEVELIFNYLRLQMIVIITD